MKYEFAHAAPPLTEAELAMIPKDFVHFPIRSEFAATHGHYYYRARTIDGNMGFGMVMQKHHLNLNQVIHGGVLATLIDVAGFMILADGNEHMRGATINMSVNYLDAALPGEFVYVDGEVARQGSSIAYTEGHLIAMRKQKDGSVAPIKVCSFSNIYKKFKPRQSDAVA